LARKITANKPKRKAQVADDPSLVVVEHDDSKTDQTEKDSARREKIENFLAWAKKCYRVSNEAENPIRNRMLEAYRFAEGEQWNQQTIADRQSDDRPVITINRIRQFTRQVLNAQRAANISIRVLPVDSGSDVKTAEILQGLIRHIEQQSDASVAYNTGAGHQVLIGRGWWRVVSEFDNDTDFQANLRIKRIRNPFSVYVDPAAQEADYSDARFIILVEDMPRDEYRAKFGDASFASLTEFDDAFSRDVDWMPEGKVKIAEVWYVDVEPGTLYLVRMPNGQEMSVTEDEYLNLPPELGEPVVIRTRPIERRVVRSALINAREILEGNEDKTAGRIWPGQWIPIIPVLGDESDINGEVDLRGMVWDAMDAQRLYNYQNTALAEVLAMVPKAPYIGFEGQFAGHEAKWRLANRRNFPYLEVKTMSLDGKPLPLPQRISASADVGAIMTAIQQSDQDLKATMGLYEPSLGIRESNAQSGKAITALQKQGELANSNFQDNMNRAIRHTGRILVDLIPHIYDAPRVIRIIGSDDREKKVMIHSGANPNQLPQPDGEGKFSDGLEGVYDLNAGQFDVVIKEGPSTANAKEQAFNALTIFVQAYPEAFPLIGDLLMSALDWPGAQAAAERLKRAVPPGILGEGEQDDSGQQMAQQLQMAMQQAQEAGATIQELQMVIKSKQIETEARKAIELQKIASQERLSMIQLQGDIKQIGAQGEIDAKLLILEAKLAAMQSELDTANEAKMAAATRMADRADADKAREEDRRDMIAGHTLERDAANEDRFEDRRDSLVTRNQDREDAGSERQRDREDMFVTRTMDRDDGRERRRGDRLDATTEREAARQDAAAERQASRQDEATTFARQRSESVATRRMDREDATVAHSRARETAKDAAKTELEKEKIKAKAAKAKKEKSKE
jgi:hypothetical protein